MTGYELWISCENLVTDAANLATATYDCFLSRIFSKLTKSPTKEAKFPVPSIVSN